MHAIGHLQFEFKSDDLLNPARLLLAQCFVGLGLPSAAEIVLTEFLARLESSQRITLLFLEGQYLLGIVREEIGDYRGAATALLAVIGRDIHFKDTLNVCGASNAAAKPVNSSARRTTAC